MVRGMTKDAYPRPSFTVDVLVLRWHNARLEGLFIQRLKPPFQGQWALPGGFVNEGEPPADAARRELVEETNVVVDELVSVGVYGAAGRDPRGWVISAAYLAFVDSRAQATAGDDADALAWHPMADLPDLAFDHAQIVTDARARLAELTQSSTAPLSLLSAPFRTKQARHLYTQILQRRISPTAFKAWLRRRQAVERTGPARFRRGAALLDDWVR